MNWKKLVGNGTGILSSLMLILSPATIPTVAQAQVRASTMATTAFTCTGNRFTNGDFSLMNSGRSPDAAGDQDIDAAQGWKPLWQGGSLADLYSQGVAGTGSPPTPANGNYASMWITNRSTSADDGYREGMYNQLVTPIAANTGTYSFTFKTAPLTGNSSGDSTYVGVYGVKQTTNAALPPAPTGVNTPTNLTHFGPNTTVYLGKVEIPTNATNAWQNQTMSFDSAAFGGVSDITHVMVTKLDNAPQKTSIRYVAFDDFCMQTSVDHAGDTDPRSSLPIDVIQIGTPIDIIPPPAATCPGVGCLTDTSTCCPPSATFAMGDLFDFKQQGGLNGGYYFNFADSVGTQTNFVTLNAQMIAYVNYVRALDPAFKGLVMTLRVFDGGTGTTAIAGAQMGTDSSIYWNAGATTGVLWPNSTFFGPTTTKPVNNWTVIEMVLWTQGPGRPYAQSCEKRYIQWNPLYRNSRRAGSSAGTSFTPYTGPAPASAARQPAARR